MSPELDKYLRAYCIQHAAAISPLAVLLRDFRSRIGDDARHWSRGRFITELVAAGFPVGELDQCASVGGLTLKSARWGVNSRGHLEPVNA